MQWLRHFFVLIILLVLDLESIFEQLPRLAVQRQVLLVLHLDSEGCVSLVLAVVVSLSACISFMTTYLAKYCH